MKKSIRMPYRVFSFCLAVIIISVSVPIAFAATSLSSSNVTQWPTVSYNNGEAMYFGQSVGEAVTLNGGTVTYNGAEVPGHFEFIDANETPTLNGTQRSNIKFVPDNTDEYIGFEATRNRNVTFVVSKTTPIFYDEANDSPVASEVEPGAALSTSTISGGKMVNPYNPNEPKILDGKWEWTKPNTIANESGYYEARFSATGYNIVTAQVYVKIAGEVPETTISEMPVIEPLVYDASITLKDVTIKGGVAVLKEEGTVIEGTFTIAESAQNSPLSVGAYNVPVTFTPADPEAALPYTFDIPITVSKAPIRFIDENGNDIVPEITVPYGTKFNAISRLLRPFVKGPDYTYFVMGDLSSKVCDEGTYTVKATAPDDGKYYEDTDLTFKIVVEKKKLNPKLYSTTGKLYINDNSAVYHPTGTFTLEYTIDGVEQTPITGIKYNTHFDWNPTKSGDYEYTIIYNEAAEKEYFIIDDFTTNSTIALTWGFKATGMPAAETYKYGSAVSYTAPAIDETKSDKPYYVFSEWSEVKGIEMTDEQKSNPEVSFTMPDNDVELKASYKFSFKAFFEWVLAQITQFFTFIVNAVKDLIAMM